jgi:hypothetical protein
VLKAGFFDRPLDRTQWCWVYKRDPQHDVLWSSIGIRLWLRNGTATDSIVTQSAFEKGSQSGFGVVHRASDPRREPMLDAEEEAASEAALRH